MPYFTAADDIRMHIAKLTQATTLWMDTEVADYMTKKPRLSLIQVLDNTVASSDPVLAGDAGEVALEQLAGRAYILDVLDQPDLVNEFIHQVMANPAIEKVFHNSSYDVRFLGGKRAVNVTCTLQIAKTIPYHYLPVPNRQLKTLAKVLCDLDIAKDQQGSDWGQRPLSQHQLTYALMDPVYLVKVHHCLRSLSQQCNPDPHTEDLATLAQRYLEILHDWKLLDAEINHVKERLEKAMQAQNCLDTAYCSLTSAERTSMKIAFLELATWLQDRAIALDFPVTLTKELQKSLADYLDQLPVQTETKTSWILKFKQPSEAEEA